MESFFDALGVFGIALAIAFLILTIMIIVAVLKIPKIVAYCRATMKLNAHLAEKAGVDPYLIGKIIDEAELNVELREQSRKMRLSKLYNEGKITEEQYNFYLANPMK